LIALIILGIIMMAISMSLSTGLRAQAQATGYRNASGAVREALDQLTTDIEAAYASRYNTASLFVAGQSPTGSVAQTAVPANSLLTLTTLTQRIQGSGLPGDPGGSSGASPGGSTGPSSTSSAMPQWDCNVVTYSLDTTSGTLSRSTTAVPALQDLTPPSTTDMSGILSHDVISLTLQYWDPQQQQWRSSWDYEQVNQTAMTDGASGSTTSGGSGGSSGGSTGASGSGASGGGAASASGSSSTQSVTPTGTSGASQGDSYLPSMVQVTLVVRGPQGVPATYTAMIPIAAVMPLDDNTPAPSTTPQSGGTSSSTTQTGH
jgi:type II secretory pathway pseudopilin PulG